MSSPNRARLKLRQNIKAYDRHVLTGRYDRHGPPDRPRPDRRHALVNARATESAPPARPQAPHATRRAATPSRIDASGPSLALVPCAPCVDCGGLRAVAPMPAALMLAVGFRLDSLRIRRARFDAAAIATASRMSKNASQDHERCFSWPSRRC